jgi:hypothetical protein
MTSWNLSRTASKREEHLVPAHGAHRPGASLLEDHLNRGSLTTLGSLTLCFRFRIDVDIERQDPARLAGSQGEEHLEG